MTTIAAGSSVIIDAGYKTRIAPINVGGEVNVAGEVNLANGAADGTGLATGAATADPTRTDAAAGIGDGDVADYANLRVQFSTNELIPAGSSRTVGTVDIGGELNTAGELSTFSEQTATPTKSSVGAGIGDSQATASEFPTVRCRSRRRQRRCVRGTGRGRRG